MSQKLRRTVLMRGFQIGIWLLVIAMFLLFIVFPLLTSGLFGPVFFAPRYAGLMHALESLQLAAMRGLIAVWVFYVGSCFASFLNVVAWRVPRGRTILGSSKCPYCNQELTFRNNIPIFGWLKNGGRCQKCRLPISSRYLFAEVCLGAIFLALAFVEMTHATGGLPFQTIGGRVSWEDAFLEPQTSVVLRLVFHLILVASLFTMSLIGADRFPVPWRVSWIPLWIGVVSPWIWSELMVVPWFVLTLQSYVDAFAWTWETLVITQCLGVATAVLAAAMFPIDERDARPSFANFWQRGTTVEYLLVGLYLGWQSVVAISLLVMALWALKYVGELLLDAWCNIPRLKGVVTATVSWLFLLATVLHLIFWRLEMVFLTSLVGSGR